MPFIKVGHLNPYIRGCNTECSQYLNFSPSGHFFAISTFTGFNSDHVTGRTNLRLFDSLSMESVVFLPYDLYHIPFSKYFEITDNHILILSEEQGN
jgi:hypothetical protein